MALEERFRKLDELRRKAEDLVNWVADPYNKKISQVRMRSGSAERGSDSLILFTELPHKVNVTEYSARGYDQGEIFPFLSLLFNRPFVGTKRIIEQRRVPLGLYWKFWRFLEDNNVWELKDAKAIFKDKEGHQWKVYDTGYCIVEVSKRSRTHKFKVELSGEPHYDRPFLQHRKIMNRISSLYEFSFPPPLFDVQLFAVVKSVQPILDEISREELRFKGY